jgi:hypothetical protein
MQRRLLFNAIIITLSPQLRPDLGGIDLEWNTLAGEYVATLTLVFLDAYGVLRT